MYFLNALGSVFDFSELEYAAALDDLITREMIAEVINVNDTQCTFINNIAGGGMNYNTKAEQ
ncbi:MAG: hypothetical protein EOP45_02275 [Sphingobacteriaceae bacterium]|nr:MAG: hypothetical protein EOP45_02275 [Sphingobacteriaceae bacterium]